MSPPCNVGIRSTPNYPALADSAIYDVGNGIKVFAGQRLDGFYVDLGSIFDLGALRPFQNLHLIPTPATDGINALRSFNVHTLAIQVPIAKLAPSGRAPKDPMAKDATIGVWASASRRKATLRDGDRRVDVGPFVQVSRLGNPLFNEVVVPIGRKDEWNSRDPYRDADFATYVKKPELAALLPVLYPGVFPNLAALTADRADLVAILLTGFPAGIVPGFQNYTGPVLADQLRLNMADPAGRRAERLRHPRRRPRRLPERAPRPDDVVTIELRAIAGATYPLVDPTFTPDGAAALVNDGTQVLGDVSYLDRFPYLDHPVSGYDVAAAAGHDGMSGPTTTTTTRPLESITHVHGGAMVSTSAGRSGPSTSSLDEAWAGRELFLARATEGVSASTPACGCATSTASTSPRRCSRRWRPATYRVLDRDDGAALATVQVAGGEVAELDLSGLGSVGAAPADTVR